jgi:putative glycosyltransferase
MKLSVVTSMYRSEGFVKDFYAAISRVASEITDQLEIIFVDDGSPDHSAPGPRDHRHRFEGSID